jgi:hypothetical protein
MQRSLPYLARLLSCGLLSTTAAAVDFKSQIMPILNNKCAKCHSEAKGETKGDFAVDNLEQMKKEVRAGKPEASNLVIIITAPDDDDDLMPPKGKGTRVSGPEVALIKKWIMEGASFEAGGSAPAATGSAAPAIATWTNADGSKTIQAIYERMEGDSVVLRMAGNKYVKIPLTNLSAESQAMAKQAAGM